MATTPLDMFEFCRNIGKGSYGEVTLARHKRDRKQVMPIVFTATMLPEYAINGIINCSHLVP